MVTPSIVLATVAASWLAAFDQLPASTTDPSPHEVRTVTVDTSVRLEVLDWGCTGRPLLFVGCYLSAHVFDDIAPKLRDRFHVYAVTRRGIGASRSPSSHSIGRRRWSSHCGTSRHRPTVNAKPWSWPSRHVASCSTAGRRTFSPASLVRALSKYRMPICSCSCPTRQM